MLGEAALRGSPRREVKEVLRAVWSDLRWVGCRRIIKLIKAWTVTLACHRRKRTRAGCCRSQSLGRLFFLSANFFLKYKKKNFREIFFFAPAVHTAQWMREAGERQMQHRQECTGVLGWNACSNARPRQHCCTPPTALLP